MDDDDFSFITETRRPPRVSGGGAQQQQPVRGPQAQHAQQVPAIPIPSFSQMPPPAAPSGSMSDLFRPRGLLAEHQQRQQQQGTAPSRGVHDGLRPTGAGVSSGSWQGGGPPSHPQPYQPPAHQPPPQQAQQAYQQQPALAASAAVAANANAIIVSRRQQGNPVLKHIRNVRWVFGDVGPDYVLGANTCALYLSLRYHLLHPNYILYRIKELQRAWALRVLLVHCDVDDVVHPLGEVTKTAAMNDCTLVCAWSAEEAARYLETFKAYEHKPSSTIQERVEGDYASRLASALTAVRAVNRTDALALGAQFGTLADIFRASPQQLSACPGIGPTKVQNLWDAFNKPFRKPTPAAPGLAGPSSAQTLAAGSSATEHVTQVPGAAQVGVGAELQGAGTGTDGGVADQAVSGAAGLVAVPAPAGNQSGGVAGSSAGAGQPHDRMARSVSEGTGASGIGAVGASGVRATGPDTAPPPTGLQVAFGMTGNDSGGAEVADSSDEDGDDSGNVQEEEEGEQEEEEEDDLQVHEEDELFVMASQIMLQVQAGAMAAGTLDSGFCEGSQDGADEYDRSDMEEL